MTRNLNEGRYNSVYLLLLCPGKRNYERVFSCQIPSPTYTLSSFTLCKVQTVLITS